MKYPTVQLTNLQELEVKKFNQNKKIRLETLNCINCKSLNYKELYANDSHGINQQTFLCNACGLVYSNPRMTEESLKYFYSSNLYREVYEASDDSEHSFSEKVQQVENLKMGDCVSCHKDNGAPTDCTTCHY